MTTMTSVLCNGNKYINDAAHDLDVMISTANGNFELANSFLMEARSSREVELAVRYAKEALGIQYHLFCIMNYNAELPFGCRMSWVKDAYASIKGSFDFNEAEEIRSWYKIQEENEFC